MKLIRLMIVAIVAMTAVPVFSMSLPSPQVGDCPFVFNDSIGRPVPVAPPPAADAPKAPVPAPRPAPTPTPSRPVKR